MIHLLTATFYALFPGLRIRRIAREAVRYRANICFDTGELMPTTPTVACVGFLVSSLKRKPTDDELIAFDDEWRESAVYARKWLRGVA